MRIDPKMAYNSIQEKSFERKTTLKKSSDTTVQTTKELVIDSKVLNHANSIKNNEVYRAERVESIKASLKNGTYSIDTNAIASKLLDK